MGDWIFKTNTKKWSIWLVSHIKSSEAIWLVWVRNGKYDIFIESVDHVKKKTGLNESFSWIIFCSVQFTDFFSLHKPYDFRRLEIWIWSLNASVPVYCYCMKSDKYSAQHFFFYVHCKPEKIDKTQKIWGNQLHKHFKLKESKFKWAELADFYCVLIHFNCS